MIDGKFDVVFRGQTTKNFDVDQVKQNLVKLFKSTPEGIDKLFTGSEVVIRKDLDYTQAMKYQSALKNAGALALIKEVENPQQEGAVTEIAKQQVSQPAKFQSKEETEAEQANATPLNQESNNQQSDSQEQANQEVASESANEGDFGLAKAGEKILPDKVYEKREVNTDHLSVGEIGDKLLPEKPPEEHPKPSIDHLSLEDPK